MADTRIPTPKLGTLTLGNTPITPATFPGSVERQIAIETALADALHYIRMPYSAKTLNATTARTRRALTLLKQVCAEAKNGGEA